MKKHIWRLLIFLVAFSIGFIASPIRFSEFAMGSGMRGGYTAYSSTYFKKVGFGYQPYETIEEADEAFGEQVKLFSEYVWNQKVLETGETRAIISFEAEYSGLGFCVLRKEKTYVYTICSTSLGHVREFEKQKFSKK